MKVFRFEVSFRQSKIGNPISKIGCDRRYRFAHSFLGGATAEAQQTGKSSA